MNKFISKYVIIWSLVGYALMASLMEYFSVTDQIYSMIFRGLALFGSVALIINSGRFKLSKFIVIFILFWIGYFLRLIYSFEISNEIFSIPETQYWLWSIGVSFIPSLSIYTYKRVDFYSIQIILGYTCAITIILLLLLGSTEFMGADGIYREIGRLSVLKLDPISIGNVAALGIIISFSFILNSSYGFHIRLINFLVLFLSVILMVLANSRGPIISAAIAFFAFIFVRFYRALPFYLFLILTIILVVTCFDTIIDVLPSDGFGGRFRSLAEGRDLSSAIRQTAFEGALQQFYGSPYWGDGIEERLTQFYPHNVTLEAFMATGFIGGLLFLYMEAMSICYAIKVFRYNRQFCAFGLLAIQQVLQAQISGSLCFSSAMWIAMMLIILLHQNLQEKLRVNRPDGAQSTVCIKRVGGRNND